MAKFEIVSKYADAELILPERKTEHSAGYDLASAQDILIPPMIAAQEQMNLYKLDGRLSPVVDLDEFKKFTKETGIRPTLVSTGLKCKLDPGTYLELSVRSSTPLNYWLILANGVGIIDADYYNNPSNEGEIFLQLINLSPYILRIHKGDILGQGIIKPYLTTENDNAQGERVGGFGSTSN